jgi:hypothetical protein
MGCSLPAVLRVPSVLPVTTVCCTPLAPAMAGAGRPILCCVVLVSPHSLWYLHQLIHILWLAKRRVICMDALAFQSSLVALWGGLARVPSQLSAVIVGMTGITLSLVAICATSSLALCHGIV